MRVKFLDSLLCRDELKKARNILLVTKGGTTGLEVFIHLHFDFKHSMILMDISSINETKNLGFLEIFLVKESSFLKFSGNVEGQILRLFSLMQINTGSIS